MRRVLPAIALLLLVALSTATVAWGAEKSQAQIRADVLEQFKQSTSWERESMISRLRERGIEPTWLIDYREAEKARRRNAQIAAVVAVLGLIGGGIYAAIRLGKAGWKRREQAVEWAEKQRDRMPDLGDGSRRAKRDLLRYQELETLARLHKDGVIDDDEFEKRKRVALGEEDSHGEG
jgi:hypothetical protein